jgi:hypothetical protein
MLIGMVFAGPVFTEWYWTPVFFLIVYGPLLVAGTTAACLVLRRRGQLTLARAVAAFLVTVAVVLVGSAVWREIAFQRAERRDARSLDFVTLAPRGLSAERQQAVVADHVRALTASYEGPLYVDQQRAGRFDLADPARCAVFVAGPLAEHPANTGPCRRLMAGELEVALVDGTPLAEAYAVRDGTLVQVRHAPGAHDAAVAMLQRMEPVDRNDLDFER